MEQKCENCINISLFWLVFDESSNRSEMSGLHKFICDIVPEVVIDLFDTILFSGIILYFAARLLGAYYVKNTKSKIR